MFERLPRLDVILLASEIGDQTENAFQFSKSLGKAISGDTQITCNSATGEIRFSFPSYRDGFGNIGGVAGAFIEIVDRQYVPRGTRLTWRVARPGFDYVP